MLRKVTSNWKLDFYSIYISNYIKSDHISLANSETFEFHILKVCLLTIFHLLLGMADGEENIRAIGQQTTKSCEHTDQKTYNW